MIWRLINYSSRLRTNANICKLFWLIRKKIQGKYNSILYERLVLGKNVNAVMTMANEGNIIERTYDIIKQTTIVNFLGIDKK